MKQQVPTKFMVALTIERDGQMKAYHILFKLIKKKKKGTKGSQSLRHAFYNEVSVENRMQVLCVYYIFINMYYLIGGSKIFQVCSRGGSCFPRRELKYEVFNDVLILQNSDGDQEQNSGLLEQRNQIKILPIVYELLDLYSLRFGYIIPTVQLINQTQHDRCCFSLCSAIL